MIFGCRSIFKIQISRVTRSISDCSMIFYFWSVLTATFCSVITCVPKRTFPNVPSPMLLPELQLFLTYFVVSQYLFCFSRHVHFQIYLYILKIIKYITHRFYFFVYLKNIKEGIMPKEKFIFFRNKATYLKN
jgi:hypothetical protein